MLSFQLLADDDDKLKLAVMDLEDLSGKLSEETLSGASEYFRVIFAQTNRYIIISKDRQKEQISGLRKKYNTDPTYKSCTDKNCQIQLGQALSADLIVKTSVSFFADSYTLASELIDLEKEATIIAATEDYDGSPQALKTAIKSIVDKIVEAEKKENELTEEEISEKAAKKNKKNSVNSKDLIACEYARNESSDLGWKVYLEKYPNGECATEAKEKLDNIACEKAEKLNSDKGWEKYLKEFPDGKCELKARTAFLKSNEAQKVEQAALYSKADEKLEGLFSGRFNFGVGYSWWFSGLSLSSGFDFNFKVFEKPYGASAGNLFVGFGTDFIYYTPLAFSIPIMANLAYEFKTNNKTLRYVGILFSAGYTTLIGGFPFWFTDISPSFNWEIGMNMIFSNKLTIGLGFDGPSVPIRLYVNVGTIF